MSKGCRRTGDRLVAAELEIRQRSDDAATGNGLRVLEANNWCVISGGDVYQRRAQSQPVAKFSDS